MFLTAIRRSRSPWRTWQEVIGTVEEPSRARGLAKQEVRQAAKSETLP